MSKYQKALLFFQCLFFVLVSNYAVAQPATAVVTEPAVSIIIDDLGYRLKYGTRAVNLPGKLTFSFLPFSPHARKLANQAHQRQQEIMVHMPMESSDKTKPMGPGGLHQNLSEDELVKKVRRNIQAIPYAVGFNNHMGSLLTSKAKSMATVMKAAYSPGIYFIDSRTTSESVALQHAQQVGLYGATRDIFLDHVQTSEFVEGQLSKLVKLAKKKGTAIAIAHPYRSTLDVLEKWLPQAEQQYGIKLVHVSELIKLREQRRLAWQESSSHSPRAAKN